MRRETWIIAGLLLATLLVYAQTYRHEFLRFDDPGYVTRNPHVRAGLTADGALWALRAVHGGNWHPLTTLSHMLDCELFGLDPGPPHLVNALLHAASAVLLFVALLRMTSAVWPSALVAALFALHPLRVESVAWISERKDVLSGLFWMLTLLAYSGYARRPGAGRYLLVAVCLALGLTAKPMLVTLPFVLLLLDVWPLGRLSKDRWWSQGGRLVIEKLPLIAIAAASSVVTLRVQGSASADLEVFPFAARIANAAHAYWAYLADTVWPRGLAPVYPLVETPSLGLAAFGLTGLLATTTLAVLAGIRRPYIAVGWLWYVGTLVPVIGLVQVGEQSRADRYTYLPLVGIFVLAAWLASDLVARWRPRKTVVAGVGGAVLLSLGVASAIQAARWRDDLTLFAHTVEVTDDNYVALTTLGGAMIEAGREDEAIPFLHAALSIRPDYFTAHAALGAALARQGDMDGAVEHFQHALRSKPGLANMHYNLGRALVEKGELNGAIPHLLEALRIEPTHIGANNAMAHAYTRKGSYDRALPYWSRLVRLLPDDPRAGRGHAVVLHRLGRVDEAVAEARRALRLAERQGRSDLAGQLRRQLDTYSTAPSSD